MNFCFLDFLLLLASLTLLFAMLKETYGRMRGFGRVLFDISGGALSEHRFVLWENKLLAAETDNTPSDISQHSVEIAENSSEEYDLHW